MAIWDPIVQPVQGAINWIGTVVSPAPSQSVGGRSGNEPVVVSQPVTQPVTTTPYNPFGASGGFGGGGAGGGGTPVVSTPSPQPAPTPAYNPFGASGGFGGGGTTGSSGQTVQNPVTGNLERVTAQTNPLANLVTGIQQNPTQIVTAGIPTAAASVGAGVTVVRDIGADALGLRTQQYQQNVASYRQQVSAYEKQVAAYEGRVSAYELGVADYQKRVNDLNYEIAAFNQLRPPQDQAEYISRTNTLNTLQTRRDEIALLGAGLGAQQQELGTLREDLLGVGTGLETRQAGLAAEKEHIESTGIFGIERWFENADKFASQFTGVLPGKEYADFVFRTSTFVNPITAPGAVADVGASFMGFAPSSAAKLQSDYLSYSYAGIKEKPVTTGAWALAGLAMGGAGRLLGPAAESIGAAAAAKDAGLATRGLAAFGKYAPIGIGVAYGGMAGLQAATSPDPLGTLERIAAQEVTPMMIGGMVGYRLPEIGRGAYQLGSHVADSKYLASLNRDITSIRAREFGVVEPGGTKIQWRTGTKIPQRQVVHEPSRRMDWNYATGKWEPATSDKSFFDFLRVDKTQRIRAGRAAAPELEARLFDVEGRIKADYATGQLAFELPSAEGRLALSDRFYRGPPESWLGKTYEGRTTRVILPEGEVPTAKVTSRYAMPDEFGRGRWTYSGFPEEKFTRVAESRVRRGTVGGSGVGADVVNENYLRDVTRRVNEQAMQNYLGEYNAREFGLPASERARLRWGEREVIGGGMKINVPESTRLRIKESRDVADLYSWWSEKVTVQKPARRVTARPSSSLQDLMEQAELSRQEKMFPSGKKPKGAPGSPELEIKPTAVAERELPVPDSAAAYTVPAMDVGTKGIYLGRSELPNVAGFVRGRRGVRLTEDEGYGSIGPLSFKPLKRLDEERNVFVIPVITGGSALASVGVQSAIAPTLSLPSDSATRDLVGVASLPTLDVGIREIMGVDVVPTVTQTPTITQIPGLGVTQIPALDTTQIPGLDVLQIPDIIQVPTLTPPEHIPPDFGIPDIPLTPFEFPPLPPFPGFGLPIDGGGGGGGGGYFRWPFFFEETWDVGSPLDDYFGIASADAAYLGNIASHTTGGISTRKKRKKR